MSRILPNEGNSPKVKLQRAVEKVAHLGKSSGKKATPSTPKKKK